MARTPVLAAGGIVLRQARTPLIAVVCLRKRNEWVLPKGKLDDGETPRDAALREVWEETGHEVSVHEFLGTLAYDGGGRSKIVHYWRMETSGKPTRELMHDVRAVDWLPLEAALARLSREHERAFLANVGPLALEAARRSSARKQPSLDKRRRALAPPPSPAIALPVAPSFDGKADASQRNVAEGGLNGSVPSVPPRDDGTIEPSSAALGALEMNGSSRRAVMPLPEDQGTVVVPRSPRINVMQRVRRWLRRVV
jgi:8-oxo-dGTP diphosphatase